MGRAPREGDVIKEGNGGNRLDIVFAYMYEIEWNILEWIINHENFFKEYIIFRKKNIVRSIQVNEIMTVCSLGNKGEYKTGVLIKDKYKTREFCQFRKYYLVKK